jgi:hypothetical protein
LIARLYELKSWGFPAVVCKIRELGTVIARTQDPSIELGKKWLEGFKRRHLEIETEWSKQLDYAWAVQGGNISAFEDFFAKVRATIYASLETVLTTFTISQPCHSRVRDQATQYLQR